MFNPFLIGPFPKAKSEVQVPKDERFVQESRLANRQEQPRLPLTLLLGRLLIRMGNKLVQEESMQSKPGHIID
jgi:hypothetical protein